MQCVAAAAVLGGALVNSAVAEVFFSEDWQNQTPTSFIPTGTPAIGSQIDTSPSTGDPYPISLSVFPNIALPAATGGKAVKVGRPSGTNPVLAMYSNNGAMTSGKTLEYTWMSYQEGLAFNAPQQIGLGMANGLVGRLLFVGVNDLPGKDRNYFYQGQDNQVALNLKPTGQLPGEVAGWDKIRIVANIVQSVDFPEYMTGTFDMFITQDVTNLNTPETPPTEVPLITNGLLGYALIPTEDLATTPFDDRTAGLIRIARGPEISAGPAYFDNIVLKTVVPPPSEWAVNNSGDWDTGSNWNGVVPNAIDATALFGSVITAPRTVNTTTPVVVGAVTFNNANAYTIAGTGSLTFSVGSGSALINVQQGSHTISAPTIFSSNTNVNAAAGAGLRLAGPTTIEAGKTVTKTGTLTVTGPLTLDGGAKLVLDSGSTSIKGAPTLLAGAMIDVQDNTLMIDYTGMGTVAGAIKAQLTTGYNAGAWNGDGINTSLVAQGRGLGWKDSPGTSSITIKYAYYGDTNLDAIVNFDDLLSLAQAYGSSGVWANGDSDYNNQVNFDDLLKLAQNYGLSLLADGEIARLGDVAGQSFVNDWALATSLVPEPTSGFLIAGASCMGVRRRRVG